MVATLRREEQADYDLWLSARVYGAVAVGCLVIMIWTKRKPMWIGYLSFIAGIVLYFASWAVLGRMSD
jgi:hypothetical protein